MILVDFSLAITSSGHGTAGANEMSGLVGAAGPILFSELRPRANWARVDRLLVNKTSASHAIPELVRVPTHRSITASESKSLTPSPPRECSMPGTMKSRKLERTSPKS